MNVFNRKRMMEIEFQFRDVKDPNLFRNIFPYNEVPRLVNHRTVPMNILKGFTSPILPSGTPAGALFLYCG